MAQQVALWAEPWPGQRAKSQQVPCAAFVVFQDMSLVAGGGWVGSTLMFSLVVERGWVGSTLFTLVLGEGWVGSMVMFTLVVGEGWVGSTVVFTLVLGGGWVGSTLVFTLVFLALLMNTSWQPMMPKVASSALSPVASPIIPTVGQPGCLSICDPLLHCHLPHRT